MALCINQSGTYRNARTLCVNQSGTYRNLVRGCINQASTYRCFGFTAATITSFTATPNPVNTGCSTTLCWTIVGATTASISPTVGTISPAVTGSSVVTPGATTTFTLSVGGGGANPTCALVVTDNGPPLGSSFGGGFLICKQAPNLRWVVSPYSAEVSRSWGAGFADAPARAQQVTGVSGWFFPDYGQLQNPGYRCRSFWGPSPCYSNTSYWSGTEDGGYEGHPDAFYKNFNVDHPPFSQAKGGTLCVRAFRCVTY